MKKLIALFVFAVAFCATAFAQDASPIAVQVPDFITNLIVGFAQSHPWAVTTLALVGALRLVFKPIMTAVEKFVASTSSQDDDATLAKVEASPFYRWFAFLLDYAASIKVGPQK